jgi:hypothetical protein
MLEHKAASRCLWRLGRQRGQALFGQLNRLENSGVCAAAAQMAIQNAQDLCAIRRPLVPEHQDHGHQDAIEAIATLRRLHIDEGAVHHSTDGAGDQMLNGFHALLVRSGQRGVTGLNRLAIQAHRAGTTVTTATAKTHTFAIELLAQHIKERRLPSHFDRFPSAIEMNRGQVNIPQKSTGPTARAAKPGQERSGQSRAVSRIQASGLAGCAAGVMDFSKWWMTALSLSPQPAW